MRYEVIRYPSHFEVIDHAQDRLSVYETRRLELARRERDKLNRAEIRRLAELRRRNQAEA
jgi:hypothetical protein